jgi:hypothetical protein
MEEGKRRKYNLGNEGQYETNVKTEYIKHSTKGRRERKLVGRILNLKTSDLRKDKIHFILCILKSNRVWGPPNLLYNGYQGLFPWRQNGRGVKLTVHLLKIRIGLEKRAG